MSAMKKFQKKTENIIIIEKKTQKLEKNIGREGDQIYKGIDLTTKEPRVFKCEVQNRRQSSLKEEYLAQKELMIDTQAKEKGIPNVQGYGKVMEQNVLVMDPLGPNLEAIFHFCKKKFSLKTVLLLAEQMIDNADFIHSRHLLHRSLKPDNQLIGGAEEAAKKIQTIDFALANKYKKMGTHIKQKDDKQFIGILLTSKESIGNIQFASANTHFGIRQSRRDDMESIGQTLIYFLKGKLPWSHISGSDFDKKERKIGLLKRTVSTEELCEGIPREFFEQMSYCKNLQFTEKPNQTMLKKQFRKLYDKMNFDNIIDFEWLNQMTKENLETYLNVENLKSESKVTPSRETSEKRKSSSKSESRTSERKSHKKRKGRHSRGTSISASPKKSDLTGFSSMAKSPKKKSRARNHSKAKHKRKKEKPSRSRTPERRRKSKKK